MDLRPAGEGPVRFARWLAETSRASDGERFEAVHVLEEDHLLVALRTHHIDEVEAAARAAARDTIAREGAGGAIRDVRIVQALNAASGLHKAAEEAGVAGLVIGRAAGRESRAVVRLGRVARRVARASTVPTIVVPPDLAPADLGGGPVLALTDVTDGSRVACDFASTLARRLGRRLAVLHVARAPQSVYALGATFDASREALRDDAKRALRDWVSACGIAADDQLTGFSSPVDDGLEIARDLQSPLIVTGSRRLSAAERLLQASVGSSLAALSPVPVAIVPPMRAG